MEWLWTAQSSIDMRTLWRGFVRTTFWSYERGSWPYDVMVIAILVFVLLTPRSWFHDQPQTSAFADSNVKIVFEDAENQTQTYRIQATLLPAPKRSSKATPELERELHAILASTVEGLRGRTFQVRRISPARAGDGSLLYYDVTVHR